MDVDGDKEQPLSPKEQGKKEGGKAGRWKAMRRKLRGKGKEEMPGSASPERTESSGESLVIDLGKDISKEELAEAMENVVAALEDKHKLEENGVECVLALMRIYSKDPPIQTEICRLLMELAVKRMEPAPIFSDKIREAGGILLLLLTMQNHVKDHRVQTWAIGALRKLAFDPLSRHRIVEIGGVESILSAMIHHQHQASVQEQACAALLNLSLGDSLDRKEIHQNGGVKIIINTMQHFPHHPKVMAMAIGALTHLAVEDDIKDAVRDCSGLVMIIECLIKYKDVEVIERACGALKVLSVNATNASLIARQGGIPALLQTMEIYISHYLIQEYSAACLQNLAVDDFIRDRIVARGGVRRLLTAMYEHHRHMTLLAQCCATLMNLATTDNNRVVMLCEGAIDALIFAMQPIDNALVQEHACAALANLALNGKCAVKISEIGIPAILSAMSMHPENGNVQAKACGAVLNLSEFDIVRRRLNRMRAAQALLEAMENHPHHDEVRKYTTAALLRIMSDDGKPVPHTP